MADQNKNRNKIGARCLTETEAGLILPTYHQIAGQVEQFRREKEAKESSTETGHNRIQKTNNIGIIGVRGAGKTSLLKTIQADLERDNENRTDKDLIFPIIVPENMSESSTLMATILGMFKEFVDARVRKEDEKRQDEYCRKKSSFKKSYDEVVKQYTYIQKEYRNIMIQEYTTENDYTRSSAKIFNSDAEFINKFNDLIDMFMAERRNAMIFLFIDDIDLSTYRCADVVKTLLSYLSNENIITFISGDLETFEEALTLDFLRQEGVLEKDILGESMLAGAMAGTILDSKKKLSYEYLKKILPPVYRHHIKMWDLEEKGSYCLETEHADDRDFSQCLEKALQGWIDPAFFKLPYTYQLFDDTSRGLNNVYNVLNDIIEKRQMGQKGSGEDPCKERFTEEKKQLLDTIISSRQIYNQYRDQMQGQMFFAGAKRSEVSFDNALAIIYGGQIQNPTERFALFVFVDFAARILYGEQGYAKKTEADRNYERLKIQAVRDLLLHPEIAGKVRNMEIDLSGWEGKDTKETKTGEERQKEPVKETEVQDVSGNGLTLSDVSTGFLTKGDLIFNLAFYSGLSLDQIQDLYKSSGETKRQTEYTAEQEQEVFLAFGKAMQLMKEVRKQELPAESYYAVFWKEFGFIQNRLSSLPEQNEMIRLFDMECGNAVKEKIQAKDTEGAVEEDPYYTRRILLNTTAEVIAEREKAGANTQKTADRKEGAAGSDSADMHKIRRILAVIDQKGLWREPATESVIVYLKQKVEKYLKTLRSELLDPQKGCKIDIKNAVKDWEKFYDSYDGVSDTKAAKTKRAIKAHLKSEAYKGEKSLPNMKEIIGAVLQEGIGYKTFMDVMRLAGSLAGNYRVWYGRAEAQELQNGLMKSAVKMDAQKQEYSDFGDHLQYYYKYKISMGDKAQIQQQAALLQQITVELSIAHQNADKKVLDAFMEQINEGMEEGQKIDSKEFKELFEKNTDK